MEGAKRKIAAENTDLLRQLQVMENSANMLSMLKLTLADQLDKARAVAENEALGEADMLRVRYEKEGVAKAEELEMAKLKMQVCHCQDVFLSPNYISLLRLVCPRPIPPLTS